mmetsp:Transcript_21734/g.76319  ORF Transcript_21734/g.76319 Transcript_21734/m.76319 type:complete len:213 (+) Transcript_21734:1271-1909(+)
MLPTHTPPSANAAAVFTSSAPSSQADRSVRNRSPWPDARSTRRPISPMHVRARYACSSSPAASDSRRATAASRAPLSARTVSTAAQRATLVTECFAPAPRAAPSPPSWMRLNNWPSRLSKDSPMPSSASPEDSASKKPSSDVSAWPCRSVLADSSMAASRTSVRRFAQRGRFSSTLRASCSAWCDSCRSLSPIILADSRSAGSSMSSVIAAL